MVIAKKSRKSPTSRVSSRGRKTASTTKATRKSTGSKRTTAKKAAGESADDDATSATGATTTTAATSGKGKTKARANPDAPARSNPLGLEIDDDVLEFIDALDRFKHDHNRPFPSWSEVLFVLRELGYRKR